MESLEALTSLMKELPQTALWAIILFFFYKIIIVGSLYGVIRFVVKSLSETVKHFKKGTDSSSSLEVILKEVEEKHEAFKKKIDDMAMPICQDDLLKQIARLKTRSQLTYIHTSDVEWLEKLFDEHLPTKIEKGL